MFSLENTTFTKEGILIGYFSPELANGFYTLDL
jgi:hypothetical protein